MKSPEWYLWIDCKSREAVATALMMSIHTFFFPYGPTSVPLFLISPCGLQQDDPQVPREPAAHMGFFSSCSGSCCPSDMLLHTRGLQDAGLSLLMPLTWYFRGWWVNLILCPKLICHPYSTIKKIQLGESWMDWTVDSRPLFSPYWIWQLMAFVYVHFIVNSHRQTKQALGWPD